MTSESVVSKVQKLLRLASRNTNAEEAASAAAKAQELIDRHNLSAALLALDNTEHAQGIDDEPVVDFEGAPLNEKPQKYAKLWRTTLGNVLARANSCRVYVSDGNIYLVGRPSDAETVRYLYAYLSSEVERLASTQAGFGHVWRENFRLGVVDAIQSKLTEQRRAFEGQAIKTAAAESLTALIRVDRALTTIEARGTSVDAWMKGKFQKRAGHRTQYDHLARGAGRAAGASISIGGARGSLGAGTKALGAGKR